MLTGIKLVQKKKLIHTGPYNAGIESVWYSEEKQMLTEIKLVENTHWSLQCWYRTNLVLRKNQMRTGIKLVQNTHTSLQWCYGISLVFRKKQMRTGIKLVKKYTHVLTMLV